MKLKHTFALSIAAAMLAACSKPQVESPSSGETTLTPTTINLAAGTPADNSDYLNRDIRDDVFYFVLPDRFYNGNPDNDNGAPEGISSGGFFPEKLSGFHGGDIQGIEQKLDYLQDMGITAIWMTPILRNKAIQDSYAHHGYWVIDFTELDPHFGSNDDLKKLSEAAHARGMKIFFDIIINHTADVIKYEECHGPDGEDMVEFLPCEYKSMEQVAAGDGYTPYVPAGQENVKTPAWLNDPKYYNNQGDSTWQGESAVNGDFIGLDDLNTRHPEVVSGMIDVFKKVIDDFRPDGFRIDTVKHVDMSFWEQFSPAIMDHAKSIGLPQFFIFGEVYSGDPVVLSSYTTTGNMPSVLDFGMSWAATQAFYKPQDPMNDARRLFENDDLYNDADSDSSLLMNFIGNHDMGRMGKVLKESNPDASDAEQVQRILLAHSFMYLSRGIPVVYYGDEQGFTGEEGGDTASREDMFPSVIPSYNDNDLFGTDKTTADMNFDTEHPLYQGFAELAKLRAGHKALRHGVHQLRYSSDQRKMMAFSRVDSEEKIEYLAVFNAELSPQKVSLPASADGYQTIAGEAAVVNDGMITATLPPLTFALYKANTAVAPANDLSIALEKVEQRDDRIALHYNVGQSNGESLNLYQVTTEYKDSNGQFVKAAQDMTYPYTALIQQELMQGVEEVRVTVSNLNGKQISESFPLSL